MRQSHTVSWPGQGRNDMSNSLIVVPANGNDVHAISQVGRLPRMLIVVFFATVSGCTHSIMVATGTPELRGREAITSSAIAAARVSTAYEAVQRLQPQWLMGYGARSHESDAGPTVYLNGFRLGTIDRLRELPIENIREIQFLRPSEATTWLGTGHVTPVILVKTVQ